MLTGATGQLGSAFIERYASRYQIIALHHRNEVAFATQANAFVDPLEPSRRIDANDHAVYAIRTDLADATVVPGLIAQIRERVERVDLLINAAAVRQWCPLLAGPGMDSVERLFAINVLAPLRLSVALADAFWRADPNSNADANRSIVNISSTAGLFVYPDLGQAWYATSKAALNHLTYHMAAEFWDLGIRVNAVAPNTFPGRTDLADVLDAIVDFDANTQTGTILQLTGKSQ